MNLLFKFFPGLEVYRLWIEIALVAALVAAVWGYLGYRDHVAFAKGEAARQVLWDAEKGRQLQAAVIEAQRNAEETKRRNAAQEEAQHAHDLELAKARADAASAADAADRLRQRAQQLAAAARRAASNPAARIDSAPAGDAAGMLADVLGKAVERSRLLASYADAARRAGQQCERDYDALSTVKR